MIWEVQGTPIDENTFRDFVPDRVLYDFDGPRIFTLKNDLGEFLAYLCDEDESISRYLLAPTSQKIIESLEAGSRTVREALDQSWLWVVDVAFDGTPQQVWKTNLASIPDDALPKPHVMLWPHLEPLLSVRMVGDNLTEGHIPASVIRQAIDGVTTALKKLASKVFEADKTPGRKSNSIRQFYDLPAQRFAYGSFEISFRVPERKQMQLAEMDSSELGLEFDEIGKGLEDALKWVASTKPEEENEGLDIDLLEALEKLVPPQTGAVKEIELRGRILRHSKAPYKLTRDSSKSVRRALGKVRAAQEQVTAIAGVVRELDKDLLSFILRETLDGQDRICNFSVDLFDEVMEVFNSDQRVTVSGRENLKKSVIEVSLISREPTPDEQFPVEAS